MYSYKVRIMSGYRITIPKEIRERWGLEIGDEVELRVESGKLILRPANLTSDPVLEMLGIARGEEVRLGEVEDVVIKELEEKMERR